MRAGLAIIDAVRAIDVAALGAPGSVLQTRVGIATGSVIVGDVVGDGVAKEWAMVGMTPNMAARIESAAQPDAVWVSSETHKLTDGVFRYESAGLHAFKGVDGEVEVWRALASLDGLGRFAAVRGPQRSPLVGRDEEFSVLTSDRDGNLWFGVRTCLRAPRACGAGVCHSERLDGTNDSEFLCSFHST